MGHTAKLNKKRWQSLRKHIIARDEFRCTKCGKAGRLEVDHIKPIGWGGDPWSPNNLQTLCRGCHITKTREERNSINTKNIPLQHKKWKDHITKLLK